MNSSTEQQKLGVTSVTVIRGCSVAVAVGKDEETTLPRVSATDANVVLSAVGDLPPCRHGQRLFARNHLAIINSVHMQRRVEDAAVALGNAGYMV